MNYSKYRFNLDMQSYISQISLPVRQYDTGIVLRINLTDGGVPYAIRDGCRAVFYAKKADGNPLMNDCVIEKNTTLCYELTQQTTACSGVVDCEVRLYGADGNLITTPRFILVVDSRVVHDEDFPLSEAEQGIIDNLILTEFSRVEAEKQREETHEAMLSITKTIENKLALGEFKGDTGDSGVYVGWEEPTDPSVKVWVIPNADAESSVLRINDGQGNWIPIETIRGEPASTFFSYGTEDLKAGTTPLKTGHIYFVYEANITTPTESKTLIEVDGVAVFDITQYVGQPFSAITDLTSTVGGITYRIQDGLEGISERMFVVVDANDDAPYDYLYTWALGFDATNFIQPNWTYSAQR